MTHRIKPYPIPSNTTPFCRAMTTTRYQKFYEDRRAEANRRLGLPPHACAKRATWEIDGQLLCAQHAGIRALEILQSQSKESV